MYLGFAQPRGKFLIYFSRNVSRFCTASRQIAYLFFEKFSFPPHFRCVVGAHGHDRLIRRGVQQSGRNRHTRHRGYHGPHENKCAVTLRTTSPRQSPTARPAHQPPLAPMHECAVMHAPDPQAVTCGTPCTQPAATPSQALPTLWWLWGTGSRTQRLLSRGCGRCSST